MIQRKSLGPALCLAALGLAAHAQNVGSFRDAGKSAANYTNPVATSTGDCAKLGQQVVSVDGARMTVLTSEVMTAAQGVPDFCRIVAMLDPEVLIEVALPMRWNGRLYMRGNGGYAGERIDAPNRAALRDEALKRGFVAAQTNTGHDAVAQPLGTFAQNNLARLVDYSHRAVHLTAQASKDLAAAFYGRKPARSYFDGCSTGGRQGLMSAQRYPADFDGIAAGAPVLNFTGTMYDYVSYAPLVSKAGFTSAQLSEIGRAIVAKCDAADGLQDGVINDPRQCRINPRTDLQGLSEAQIAALEAVHADMQHKGKSVFPAWPWGSEAPDTNGISGWAEWFVSIPPPPPPPGARLASVGQALPPGETRQSAYAQTFLRYFADQPASRPDADWRTFNLDEGYRSTSFMSQMLDARNPDLGAFKARGGKMITYHGWADPALNPMMTIGYYEEAGRATVKLDDSYRLFMAPGMQHCGNGNAPNVLDAVTAVIDWVEAGRAPASLIAVQQRPDGSERSRPLCPYPQSAQYVGGDADKAASFACR
ncbi:tannase/feruloyl esterase family alpha/beta hydrolase [Variovorax ureilyticus]|uniref:Tannase/feruloyl esterase family alpha/beta hydrolase n=1 Tax=Variovorax ureilyticus TaxID=1836198 RepID=A0ABU8VHL9_9BURK